MVRLSIKTTIAPLRNPATAIIINPLECEDMRGKQINQTLHQSQSKSRYNLR